MISVVNLPFLLYIATEDYTIDSRGDVGAWVREAALTTLCNLVFLLVDQHANCITEDVCRRIVCFLMQQASGKVKGGENHKTP